MEQSENKGMQRKTIEKIIKREMKTFLNYIDDDEVRNDLSQHYILSGGAIASMLLGQTPNDYDIYIDNMETANKVANYYVGKLKSNNDISPITVKETGEGVAIYVKSAGVATEDKTDEEYSFFEHRSQDITEQYVEDLMKSKELTKEEGSQISFVTTNAISLRGGFQIILRFVGTPEQIHKNFDFAHATNYYTPSEGLVLNIEALEALMSKTLVYVGSKFPICSIFRIRKFLRRGFHISAAEMVKISWDVNKLDLQDPHVLKEQLIGCDQAYFREVINMLDNELKQIDGRTIDRTYLFQILDKVFAEEQ